MEHPVTAARAPTAARPGGSSTVAARLVKGPPRDGNRVRSKQPPGRVPEPLTVSPATISAMARSAPAPLGTAHLGRSTPPGRVLVRHLTIGFTGLGGRRRRTLSPGTRLVCFHSGFLLPPLTREQEVPLGSPLCARTPLHCIFSSQPMDSHRENLHGQRGLQLLAPARLPAPAQPQDLPEC